MAYSPSNPPVLSIENPIAFGHRVWTYKSADPAGTVDGSGYFTDGYKRGMRQFDLVIVIDTATPLITCHMVAGATASAAAAIDLGSGTTIGLATNSD